MKTALETERLLLRELIPSDDIGMFELDSDPEVHRHLGNNPVTSMAQVYEVIEMIRQQYIDNGIGRWAVILKDTDEFIGWAGLKLVRTEVNGHTNFYELGYRLIRKHWGKGYATEAAKSFIDFGFNEMNLDVIYAHTSSQNLSSQNTLRKSGLIHTATFEYEGAPDFWYEIHKIN